MSTKHSLAVLAAFRHIPVGLKVFLVALAIVDDIAGVAVIAMAYTRSLRLEYLAIAALLFAVCVLLNRRDVRRLSFYAPLGVALWWAMDMSGVHPTMAGILFALAVPSRAAGMRRMCKTRRQVGWSRASTRGSVSVLCRYLRW